MASRLPGVYQERIRRLAEKKRSKDAEKGSSSNHSYARYKHCVEPFARWIVCGKKSEQCHAAEVVQQLSAILTFKRLLHFDLNVPEFHEVTVFVGGIQLLTKTMLGSI